MIELPEELHGRLESCRTLPSVPGVVMKIVEMCGDDNVNFGQIARVLSRDPALAAAILKVANSAYYWVRSEVKTVDRAVCTLGINATLSLALSLSFVKVLRKRERHGFDHSSYWQRSVITGVAARSMARWSSVFNREELFLAGLLQDIGMLVLSEAIPQKYGPLVAAAQRSHRRLILLEKEELGTDHASVGAWLLERWNLPEDLRLSLVFSHEPESNPRPDKTEFVRTAALAGEIAEIWSNPDTVSATAEAREASAVLLKMSSENFDQVIQETAKSLPEVTAFLNVDFGGEERITQLLDQAREALIYLNLKIQQQMHQIQTMALHDGLTATHNRGYLEGILPQYFEKARQLGQPLSVIFIDLDDFKRINDTYGHQVGDSVLVAVAGLLKAAMRASDIVARYGGEEFVCILPNADENAVRMVGERLRSAIASKPVIVEGKLGVTVTASLGCATLSAEHSYETPRAMLEEADRCLYAAKQRGRNRVVLPADLARQTAEA
jgi:diguanylate cyclase (GGDEF)-like protein